MDINLALSVCLTPCPCYLPEESFYLYLAPWLLWLMSKGQLQIAWLWGSMGLTPAGQYIFAYFKRCYLSIWLPTILNVGVDWDPPMWGPGIGTLLVVGTTKNKIGRLNNHKHLRVTQELGQDWPVKFITTQGEIMSFIYKQKIKGFITTKQTHTKF